jgi:AcrR family transcriptional regulator
MALGSTLRERRPKEQGLAQMTDIAGARAPKPRAGRRRENASGKATKERLILAAERLFAERGIEGPPLEEIGLAAGQRNKTVIQYYFGNRQALVDAILDYRTEATMSLRAEMLAEMISEGREPDVRSLVSAIVIPLASQIRPGYHFVGFTAQLTLQIGPFGAGGEMLTVREALRRLLPELSPEVFEMRWGIAVDTHLITLAHIERQVEEGTLTVPLGERVADLIEVITGGLKAPLPSGPWPDPS